ncbi:MAG: class I SAM-dependent methyltransferase [Polyangiaceae bacterium]|nr:class I SAM-dependent methyltransferase [Polyangiaceae bacterium]
MYEDQHNRYTFGDTVRAGHRLGLLAQAYEPETRALIERAGAEGCALAVDLGCGPGHTTRLLHEILGPERTVGLDRSERYITEACSSSSAGVEFVQHDVAREPWPLPAADVLLCRFLLTHLSDVRAALGVWARASRPGARLLIHETASLDADHPALCRYYALVGELQRHYGQDLNVGSNLERLIEGTGWSVQQSRVVVLQKPAGIMAALHAMNITTWRHDPYASEHFDSRELDELECALTAIADGRVPAPPVRNGARQAILRRRA